MKKREFNVDLLRIISMIMIVTLHSLSRSGMLSETKGIIFNISWFIEIACYGAVDIFFLISGYFGINSKFKLSRILLLWFQVFFYLLFFEVGKQILTNNFDAINILKTLTPVTSNIYWFFTCYFVLFFFTPFINKLINNSTEKFNKAFLIILLLFFSIIPFIIMSPIAYKKEIDIFYTNRGYSVLWGIVMYSIGAILNKLQLNLYIKKKICFLNYLLSIAITFTIWFFCKKYNIYEYFAVSYTSPLIVFSAINLLLLFTKIRLNIYIEKITKVLVPEIFAVYLIHSNPNIYPIYTNSIREILNYKFPTIFFALFIIILLVYLFSSIIEFVRIKFCSSIHKLIKNVDNTNINKLFNDN